MERVVFVKDKDGKPLMPTTRFGKVRRMLKDGLAKVDRTKPFTIRLTYEPDTHITQRVGGGHDPGRTNIGVAAEISGECTALIHLTTRNKDIPKEMADRKEHRQSSRSGERKRRTRRAIKNGTLMDMTFSKTKMGLRPMMAWNSKENVFLPVKERFLPLYEKPVVLKGTVNTEAKFLNRKREPGWLTPTARHLLQTNIRMVEELCSILPVTDYTLEMNKFAFMAMEDPGIWKHKGDFQNGPLKGYSGVDDAVDAMQKGKCLLCGGDLIEHHHHIIPRHLGGSDTIENKAGLCNHCHDLIHKDEKAKAKLAKKAKGRNKKYGALSVLNQIIPYFLEYLKGKFPGHVHVTNGWDTKDFREKHGLEKTHELDAYCIAMAAYDDMGDVAHKDLSDTFPAATEALQFRRHDRTNINCQRERTYYYEGMKVAVNRHKRISQVDGKKPKKQPSDSLEEWYKKQVELYGEKEAEHMRSKLVVKKSVRYYNNRDRIIPGAVFTYNGRQYILTSQLTGGEYFRAYGEGKKNFPAEECTIITRNRGIVYI